MSLANKNILLGVTGGIAAYKSAELVRELVQADSRVRVVMTRAAKEFITPLTFQALSGHRVTSDEFDAAEASNGMDHIALARWADAILIAPASANTIAKLTHGNADNLLSTICLATQAPIALAPAMNKAMWANAATQDNCALLKKRGLYLFGPGAGQQACGDIGEGRMFEPHQLLLSLTNLFNTGELTGLNVLITAGPTREAIDPVRYISNRSSGRMGYALAEAARDAGATVQLISGPVALTAPENVDCIQVSTAQEMLAAVQQGIETQQIFISCAAVADYRPVTKQVEKIKKLHQDLSLSLVRNPDIVAEVTKIKNKPFVVGFAAETRELEKYALQKLNYKRLDMIAANNVVDPQLGFDSEENALEVYWIGGHSSLERDKKTKLARKLISLISERYANTNKQNNVTILKNAKDRSQNPR
ncbi:MAG: bifunctional phosphopantothenoylcysteine decarboxylase/phosphopantothenate--cysteine ligase CoaBC [Gammaproteobacteria bacterium]|nr:bifunctional phosphopantothenoylcysteine decarboxylase/phosphopantothenate--cysteine ligase CoaBC [Gammaproteobacteria bacterium]